METKKYRVEFFITPQIKNNKTQINNLVDTTNNKKTQNNSTADTINNYLNELHLDITDEEQVHPNEEHVDRISNDLVSTIENSEKTENYLQPEKLTKELPPIPLEVNVKINENVPHFEENIYDEPFVGNLNSNKVQNSVKLPKMPSSRFSQRYFPRPPKRTSSLKSIEESMEILEQNFQDICYHGFRNGCTVAFQQPEEVSQEVFKENWLQKLEALRQREALLRDKEVALQSQERLLFKKERQLRILERLVKDKMKQADLYLKRCKQLPGFENNINVERSSESGFSHSSRGSRCSKSENGNEIKESDEVKSCEHIYDEIMKNPPNSRSSLVTNSTETTKQNVQCVKSSKLHNSFRYKQRPKISYDDMDSTLSADVGDLSFCKTAAKFNPNLFKKPTAFQRSVSERRPSFSVLQSNINVIQNNADHCFEETKILKKFSENIIISQNKDTKFLNYGLIDNETNGDVRPKSENDVEFLNHKKHPCASLGKDSKNVNKPSKERPASWNAENDDWLQKKRQEYNMSMRRIKAVSNKENQCIQTKSEQNLKPTKKDKKETKSRKFMIFR